MDYNPISGFFEKFRKIIFQKEELNSVVLKTISEEISHHLDDDSLKIRNGCIYVKGSPIIRGEILIHKKEILEKLKKSFPENNFLDIK